ncbi:MAG TPA: chemotaxis response regulator protein-glutamate methylesterase [Fimbriimonadaceae bacterium]|nr:chemotaxis response regulator protein-glutamate methylesterase [Fimbriimonadaceae bacterium]
MPAITRVLIVDDSAAMRQLLSKILSSDPAIEVVGVAADPYIARDKIKDLRPDVLTLDVEMPRMDGLTFLEKLMRSHPMPVVMVSSLTQKGCDITMRALELGAVDFFPKPTIDVLHGVAEAALDIIAKVKTASLARIKGKAASSPPAEMPKSGFRMTDRLIAIGASTGGTEAIREVLTAMPSDAPGIVVVQHMPAGFTASFAQRLDSLCRIKVKEAQDKDRVLSGHALIAPGGLHTAVVRSGAQYSVRVYDAPPVNRHRPSVDVLFDSFAEHVKGNAVAAILTGMGDDGARGMRRMHDVGVRTFAQDEASCVIFGMPKEAIAHGGVDHVVPLDQIATRLLTAA